jgi:hypothetical protein
MMRQASDTRSFDHRNRIALAFFAALSPAYDVSGPIPAAGFPAHDPEVAFAANGSILSTTQVVSDSTAVDLLE